MSLVPAAANSSELRSATPRSASRADAPLSSRHTQSPARGNRDMIVVRRPEDSVLAVPSFPPDQPPSYYATAVKDPYVRPGSVTPYTKKFIKRFTSNTTTPAKTSSNFTGTVLFDRVSPSTFCDVKCMELVDGVQVWCANKDGSFTTYDRATGAELSRTVQRDAVCWCMLEVGDAVWCGFNDGFIRVLAKKDKNAIMNLSRHTGPVTALVSQPNGHYVFSASLDFTILQWDANDYSFAGRFIGHNSGVRALACHVDRLYSAADDGTVRAWDCYSKDHAEWRGHTQAVKFAIVVDGQLWTGSDDGTVRVWSHAGKILDVLSTPGKGPVTWLMQVGSTVWGCTVGATLIWDACTRAVLREINSDGSGYICAALPVAKNVVSRVWAAASGGQIGAWNAETELRGDDNLAEEEAKRRSEEVVYLRDALHDLQVQSAELQEQCNERLQRMQYDLQKARDEADMRTCQLADAQLQLDQARKELAQKESLLSQRDIRDSAEANRSVNRVMANHLQQTEKKLLEAEAKIQKLQSDLSKEQAVTERRSQRDSEATAAHSSTLSQLQQANLRQKELQRTCEELEESVRKLEEENNELKDENVQLAAKLDVSRRKIDEAQKVVAQHTAELKASNKERSRLAALQQSLAEGQRDTAPSSPARAPSSETSSPRAASPVRTRSKIMPILPPKPWVDRVANYVRTVCASAGHFNELPEPMQQALRFQIVRTMDPNITSVTSEDAVAYVDSVLGPSDDPPELRGCLAHGVDSLTQQQQFALVLSTMRLYNPAWMSLSYDAQVAWYESNALFPSAAVICSDAEKTVSNFTTLAVPKRTQLETAIKRSEVYKSKPGLTSTPQAVVDRDLNVPLPVAMRITRDIQSGWRKLSPTHRRALVIDSVGHLVPGWTSMRYGEQLAAFDRFFKMPPIDDVFATVNRQIGQHEVTESGVYLLRAISMMSEASQLNTMPMSKLIDYGRMRCTPAIEAQVEAIVNSGNAHSLSSTHRSALAIDYLTQLTDRFDNMTFPQARSDIEEKSPKLEVQINDSEDITANRSEVINDAAQARVDNWGSLSQAERLAWIAKYCMLPPLMQLRTKILTEWPPVNSRPLATAIMEALPIKNDNVAVRMRALDGPFQNLQPAEQQVVLREFFFTHIPSAGDLSSSEKEAWMRKHATYPSFADVQPVLFSLCEHGWVSLVPRAQAALLAEQMPPSDLPVGERYDLGRRLGAAHQQTLEEQLQRGVAGLAIHQQEALHRWFLGGFVAGWENMTTAQQLAFMRSKNLVRGGATSTLAIICDLAKADNVAVPYLEIAAGRTPSTLRNVSPTDPAMNASGEAVPYASREGSAVFDSRSVRHYDDAAAPAPRRAVLLQDAETQFPVRSTVFVYQTAPAADGTSDGKSPQDDRSGDYGIASRHDKAHNYVTPFPMTFVEIAKNFNVPLQALKDANPSAYRDDGSTVNAGTVIVIPPPSANKPKATHVDTLEVSANDNDTAEAIAYRHGVPLALLLRTNPGIVNARSRLIPGQRVYVPPADEDDNDNAAADTHCAVARHGETLTTVSQRTGIPVTELLRRNPEIRSPSEQLPAGRRVDLGQRSDAGNDPAPSNAPTDRPAAPPHVAAAASRYQVPVEELRRANSTTAPGGQLKLPPRQVKTTIGEIAMRHGIPLAELLEANPQYNGANDPVDAQATIFLPGTTPKPAPQAPVEYRPLHEVLPPSNTAGGSASQANNYSFTSAGTTSNNGSFVQQPSSPPIANTETLAELAKRLNVGLGELQQANPHIRVGPYEPLPPGTRVSLPPRRQDTPPQTVEQFARSNNTTVEEVLRHNPQYRSANDAIAPTHQVNVAPRQLTPTSSFAGQPTQPAGDSLNDIAVRYNISVAELQQANPHIRVGPYEPIPDGTRVSLPPRRTAPPQTVEQFARSNNTTVEEVLRHNPQYRSPTDTVAPSHQVSIAPRAPPPPPPPAGDSLNDIALRYNITVDELHQANPHIRTSLYEPIPPGTRVSLPPRRSEAPQTVEQWARCNNTTVEEVLRVNPHYRSRDDMVMPNEQVNIVHQPAAPPARQQPQGYSGQQAPLPPPTTLADLAQRYRYALSDMQVANPHIRNPYAPLSPSEQIYLPPPPQNEPLDKYAEEHGLPVEYVLRRNTQYKSASDVTSPTREPIVIHADAVQYAPPTPARQAPETTTKQLRVLKVPQHTSVAALSNELRVSPELLLRYNPTLGGVNASIPASSRVVLPPEAQVPDAGPARQHEWNRSDSVSVVAKQYGVSEQALIAANSHVRWVNGAPQGGGMIIIPPADDVPSNPNAPPRETAQALRVTQQGDTLHAISHRTGIPITILQRENPDMTPHEPLAVGRRVIITTAPGDNAPTELRRTTSYHQDAPVVHVVQPGDSVASIAHRHGVTVEALLNHNPSLRNSSHVLTQGRELSIPPPPRQRPATHHEVTVTRSMTVEQFAKQYNVPVDQIYARNTNVAPGEKINAGTIIYLPPPHANNSNAWSAVQETRYSTTHYVQEGETVSSVAFRYGVSEADVRRANPHLPNENHVVIAPGRRLVVVQPDDVGAPDAPRSTTYIVQRPTAVARVAELHGVTVEDLRRVNGWDAQMSDVPSGSSVVVPGPKQRFVWEEAPQPTARATTYRASGDHDTVSSIAYRYGVTEDFIRSVNPHLRESGGVVSGGQEILIVDPGSQPQVQRVPWVIQPNESTADIARRYGVDEVALKAANPNARWTPGSTVYIPPSRYDRSYTTYESAPGETAHDVAVRYGVAEQDVIAANPNVMWGGRRQQVIIPPPPPTVPRDLHIETVTVAQANPRDTPQSFATRHGLPPELLASSNQGVELSRKMPSRVILPEYSSPSSKPLPRVSTLHTETVEAYEKNDNESLNDVATKFGLSPEVLAALNPQVAPSQRGRSTIVLPHDRPQLKTAAPTEGQYAAAEAALANRDSLLNKYESLILQMKADHTGDTRQLAAQLQQLMQEYEHVSEELQRCAASNRMWEAQSEALMSSLSSGNNNEASLRREVIRLAGELQHAKAHFAEHERRVRSEMEREFMRRARALERAHREEAEHMRAELEQHIRAAHSSTTPNKSGKQVAIADDENDTAKQRMQITMENIEPFLRHKEQAYADLLRQHRSLEEDYSLLRARCETLDEKFHTMSFAIDTRPSLLKILFDLQQLSEQCTTMMDELNARLAVRDLGRRVIQSELTAITANVKDLSRSHRWIVGNLFTEVEVLHLGASPASFADTVDPQLLVNTPKHNPGSTRKSMSATIQESLSGNRSRTPVRVVRTTTTTTTTMSLGGRRSTPTSSSRMY